MEGESEGKSPEEPGLSLNMMSALLSCYYFYFVIVFALNKAKSSTYQF